MEILIKSTNGQWSVIDTETLSKAAKSYGEEFGRSPRANVGSSTGRAEADKARGIVRTFQEGLHSKAEALGHLPNVGEDKGSYVKRMAPIHVAAGYSPEDASKKASIMHGIHDDLNKDEGLEKAATATRERLCKEIQEEASLEKARKMRPYSSSTSLKTTGGSRGSSDNDIKQGSSAGAKRVSHRIKSSARTEGKKDIKDQIKDSKED